MLPVTGTGVAGSLQGFVSDGSYYDGVLGGILLQNSSFNNITGGQIQQTTPVGGAVSNNFVGLDLNANSTVVTGVAFSGLSAVGYTSTVLRMNNNNPSTGASGFISFVGNTVGAFDVCFAFEGVTTLSVLAGNSGEGNSGAVLYTGTIGTNLTYSTTGPNTINTNSTGSPQYLAFDVNITDGGSISPVPAQSGVPSLGTAAALWGQVFAQNFVNYGTFNQAITGTAGAGGSFTQQFDLFGSGNGHTVQVVYSGGTDAVANSGTVTINAAQCAVTGHFGANNATPSGKITITGSRGGATATVLESLLQAMQTFGLIIDSTTT
jgi:hypothetical protein